MEGQKCRDLYPSLIEKGLPVAALILTYAVPYDRACLKMALEEIVQ
jgi:hypothetical protein